MLRAPEHRRNCGYVPPKSNVDDEVEDDTILQEPVTCKETLIASRTFHNFMVQFEMTTSVLLDAIRKFRNELQLDLNFKKTIT